MNKWELYLLEPVWFKPCSNKLISFSEAQRKAQRFMRHLFSRDVVFAACFNRRSSRCNRHDCTLSRINTRDISGAGLRRITKKMEIWSCLFQRVRSAVRSNQTKHNQKLTGRSAEQDTTVPLHSFIHHTHTHQCVETKKATPSSLEKALNLTKEA